MTKELVNKTSTKGENYMLAIIFELSVCHNYKVVDTYDYSSRYSTNHTPKKQTP